MKILHFGWVGEAMTSGVNVVVPQHIIEQSKTESVYFYNIRNVVIKRLKNQQVFIDDKKTFFDLIESIMPDLVIFHETYRIEYIKISKYLRKQSIPYVIIPHGELREEAQSQKWVKKKIANLLFFHKFIKNAVAIQCLSELELQQTKFSTNKFIGTNGITIPKKIKTEFRSNTIIYIGRYDIFCKGLDLLIDACVINKKFLKQENIQIELYGVNDRDKKILEQMITNNALSDLIYINGPIFDEEKISKLLNCRFFIQTSRSEGMPVGLIEALSYGVPCLITKGTTLGKIFNDYDCGWVADGDSNSIANVMVTAIKDELNYNQKSKNARLVAEDLFDWEKVNKEILKKYKSLITQ